MRPLTAEQPKGLVRIDGRPLLAYVFDEVLRLGVRREIVVVGYRGEQIVDHFGEQYQELDLQYVRQRRRLGLADAVFQAREHVDEPFLVMNGDNVFVDPVDDRVAETGYRAADGALLVETASADVVATGGEVRLHNEHVAEVVEKPDAPTSDLVTTGCYRLPLEIMDAIEAVSPSDRGELELADAINRRIETGDVFEPLHYAGWRMNVNTPEDVRAVERRLETGP